MKEEKQGFWKDFKAFIARGNVADMAPAGDDQVGGLMEVGPVQGGGDLLRRPLPLHPHRQDAHLGTFLIFDNNVFSSHCIGSG